jgi:hypothetical protein
VRSTERSEARKVATRSEAKGHAHTPKLNALLLRSPTKNYTSITCPMLGKVRFSPLD